MKKINIILITLCFFGCKRSIDSNEMRFLAETIPTETPIVFKQDLIPNDKLIHKGLFSPDLEEYYYTLSDKEFNDFNVYVVRKLKDSWSTPEEAFFNSNFNEHGMSFSPDGNSIYFSSDRPTENESIPITWHIWKSDKVNGKWQEPEYVAIPNLKDKLVSHPVITNSGTLYFHSSNLDYSEMDIYHSKWVKGKLGDAVKTSISSIAKSAKCTPFVSANEDYLIFASIGKHLDLMICFNDGTGKWINTRRLSDNINENGQGNPYVTLGNKYLFYTVDENDRWQVMWVDIESELQSN